MNSISNDGFLYPRDKDPELRIHSKWGNWKFPHNVYLRSGSPEGNPILRIIKTGISRHRDIPNWSTATEESSKIHFLSFAQLATGFFDTSVDKICMKVWYNFEASRIDIECTATQIPNIHLNFYFEPGFPTRTFDESIWDEE